MLQKAAALFRNSICQVKHLNFACVTSVIKRAQELGFSLKEIKELLALRVAPDSTQADVRERATAKISDIDEKVRRLRAMRRSLMRLTAVCCGEGPVSECPILESLSSEKGDLW